MATMEKTNAASTENAEATKPAQIEVEPLAFEEDATAVFVSGSMLKSKIDSLFKSVFADYAGCELQFNDGRKPDIITRTIPRDVIYVDLIFKENNADGYHALKRISDTVGTKLLDRMNRTLGSTKSRAYTLDDNVAQSLEEFLPYTPIKGKKVDWMQRTYECAVPSIMAGYGFGGNPTAEVHVIGLSICNLLKKIYGSEINGETFDYDCKLIRTNVNNTDIILQVSKLNVATVKKLTELVGTPYAYNMYGNPYGMYPTMG